MKVRSTVSVSLKSICIAFAYFAFLEPRYFYYVSGLKTLFRGLIVLSFLGSLCTYVFFWKGYKRSKITILVILYHVYLVALTAIRGGSFLEVSLDAINFVGLVLLTEYVIRWKPDFLLSGLLYLLLAEVFINFLTILLFPNGLYSTEYFSNNYFLGYDNQNINVLLPTLVLAITRYKYKLPYSRPILIVTLFLVLYTVLVIFSGASLVIVSLTMLLSLPFLCEMSTICNGWNYLIINVMMFFSIVIFRLQNLFSFIIVDMLGKDLTLTGRTFIWKRVNDFIKRNPILGYGVESQAYRSAKMKLKSYYGNQISSSLNSFAGLHAHNRFLETAYRGGVILTVIYCAILIISAKQLYKNKDAVIAKMMSIGMFVYLTGMLTEFYRYSYLFFPLLLMAECSAEIDGMIERKYGKMTNICSVLTFIQ